MTEFKGFPQVTLDFLRDIAAHNEKAWFEAHRADYEAGYVQPGIAFIEALGPHLRALSPQVQFASKIGGSLSRINRDVRFSRDKSPYKSHLDCWFWHGDKRGWDCVGFYFRLTADRIWLGCGSHQMPKERLERFRYAIVHPQSGNALLEAVGKVKAAGPYYIGEKTRKKPPRGFEVEGERAEYLLHEGMTAGLELPAEAALAGDFAETCRAHFAAVWPVGRWLMDEVSD